MSRKAVILRLAAHRDIDEAVDFHIARGAPDVARDFVDELETALQHLAEYPESGSPRYAQELDLPGLRYWRLPSYPYLVFYVERDEYLDIWRVLHGQRDIPEWLRGDASG